MYKMLYHINKFADIAGSIMNMSEMVITLIQHNYQVFNCAMILLDPHRDWPNELLCSSN